MTAHRPDRCQNTGGFFANHAYRILQGELQNVGGQVSGLSAAAMMRLGNPPLDWIALANGMGVPATRVDSAEAFSAALQRGSAKPRAFLIEAAVRWYAAAESYVYTGRHPGYATAPVDHCFRASRYEPT